MTVEQQIKDAKKLLGLHPGCRIVCKRKKKIVKPETTLTTEETKKLIDTEIRKAEKANYIIRTEKSKKVEIPVRHQAERSPQRPKQQVEKIEVKEKIDEDKLIREALVDSAFIIKQKLDEEQKQREIDNRINKEIIDELEKSKLSTEINIASRISNINHNLNELERNKEYLEESLNHMDRRSADAKKIRDVIKDVEHKMDIEREKLNELDKDIHLVSGQGKVGTGMTDHELDEIMKDEPHYQKCISIDEINTLKPEPIMEFIMNKSPASSEGSHWVACYIDTKKDKEIDYYDPLADDPQPQFIHDIKEYIIDKLEPNTLLKFKINKVINQRSDSDTCGLMCINFLKKRNRGMSFKDATGYIEPHIDNSNKYEAEARKIRSTAGFGYI